MIGYTVNDLLNLPYMHVHNLAQMGRRSIRTISTDSRAINADDVFIALQGDTHDGHHYVEDVLKQKALLCIVDERWYAKHRKEFSKASFFVVENTLTALGDIARSYRRKFDIPVIAITGSNGKTTTKEMIASILKTKYRVLYTTGNYNNHIGLPLTLLRMTPKHHVAVLEMGTNQPEDIKYLCSVAQQSHALITNIGHAHIELLKNRKGIAKEKSVIFQTLPKYGVAFINADEPLLRSAGTEMTKKIFFGSQSDNDIYLNSIQLDSNSKPTMQIRAPLFTKKTIECSLNLIGTQAAYNALAALAVGFVFHCPTSKMIDALGKYQSFDKRMEVLHEKDVTIINDTYNANPDSMIAALDALASMKVRGKKIAVLADMLELGTTSKTEHTRIGRYFKNRSIDAVFTYGKDARYISEAAKSVSMQTNHCTKKDHLLRILQGSVKKGDTVLVKGSRGMHMEEIVEYLQSLFAINKNEKTT